MGGEKAKEKLGLTWVAAGGPRQPKTHFGLPRHIDMKAFHFDFPWCLKMRGPTFFVAHFYSTIQMSTRHIYHANP